MERNLTSCFNYLTGIFDSETQEQAGYPYASAFAFYSAVILCLNLLPHVLFQSLPYGGVCACFMVLITGVYGLFFLQAMKKSGSAFTERRNFWTIVFSLFITGSALYYMQVLAYCFLLSVGNYNGVAGYFLGTEALDSLFHSSIIESIVNFGVPSTLYMELDFLKYHTGIHFLLAGIAKITNLPALYLLHYIFPLITFPLYAGLCFKLVVELRYLFSRKAKLNFYDVFTVSFLVLGTFFVMRAAYYGGLAAPSLYLSVSMALGMILLLILACLTCWAIRTKRFENSKFCCFYFALLLPLFIAVSSIAKVTAGLFILGAAAIYFFSRKVSAAAWIKGGVFTVYYAIVFIVVCKFMVMHSYSNETVANVIPFAFLRHWPNWCAFIVTILPVVLFLKERKWSFRKIFNGSTVLENMLLGLCAAFWIPPLICDIDGGSSCYFYMLPYTFAVIVCCAVDIPQKLLESFPGGLQKSLKFLLLFGVVSAGIMAAVYCVYPGIAAFSDRISKAGVEKVVEGVFKARKIIKSSENKSLYLAYIGDDSPLIYPYPNGTGLVVQAILGIPVINSIYPGANGDLVAPVVSKKQSKIVLEPLPKSVNGYAYAVAGVQDKLRKFDRKSAIEYAEKHGYKYLFIFADGIRLLELDGAKEVVLCPPGQQHLFAKERDILVR